MLWAALDCVSGRLERNLLRSCSTLLYTNFRGKSNFGETENRVMELGFEKSISGNFVSRPRVLGKGDWSKFPKSTPIGAAVLCIITKEKNFSKCFKFTNCSQNNIYLFTKKAYNM